MKLCLKDAFASQSFNKIYSYSLSRDELENLPAPLVSDTVEVTVTVEGESGKITCQMDIRATFAVSCGRCAKEFELDFVSNTKKPVLQDDGVCDEDAVYVNNAMCFDVNDEVFTRICFEFPMAPLCSEDCKGLCPVCGCDLNTSSCSCDTKTVDPRLAVLKTLFDK